MSEDKEDHAMPEDHTESNYIRRQEYLRKQRLKRRRRNRMIIVGTGIVILVILILIIVGLVRGCSAGSGEKEPTQPPTDATTAAVNAKPTEPVTQPNVKEIKDNGEDGRMSDGSIFIWDNKGFELFFGGDDSAKEYADKINDYKKQLGSGITVYDMVVPNHTEFGLPARLSEKLQKDGSTRSQRQNTSAIYKGLSKDIKAVDIYDVLNQHKTEYIYFNTDHHWSGLGSYYAYTKFAEVAGLKPFALEDAEKHSVDGFLGSLYTISNDSALGDNPDRVDDYVFPGDYTCMITQDGSSEPMEADIYYPNATAGNNTYGVFLWGDNPLTVIKNNDGGSGRKIALIKESYGNAFAPYLAYNYDEVHVIDFRYYSGSLKQYCSDNGITEVLFLNGVMSANTPLQLDNMDGLFQ